ncbi:MAG: 50S ribosomal protein L29 [Bdellovibrionales bacterium]|nr:50S ribosomal protein L29 [Bdellovibrionales bacterium]
MKFKEIKDLSPVEIKKSIVKKNEELYELRVKNNLGQLSNPVQIRYLRKDIARLKTAMTFKKLEV